MDIPPKEPIKVDKTNVIRRLPAQFPNDSSHPGQAIPDLQSETASNDE